MKILAFETSCDETAIAVVQDGKKVEYSVVSSQAKKHAEYGGVVPLLAARMHFSALPLLLSDFLKKHQSEIFKLDQIAYTAFPGLINCLQIGRVAAETLALYLKIPVVGCNHLLSHLYVTRLRKKFTFPLLGLVISGGHTELYVFESDFVYELLGETVDDAVGECFDKTAVLLGYQYPGGKTIEKLALQGKKLIKLISLPQTKLGYNFSFSGLKTAARRFFNFHNNNGTFNVFDFAFSFQETIRRIFCERLEKAVLEFKPKMLVVGGGVISNLFFRKSFLEFGKKNNLNICFPEVEYSTDNAVMVAVYAYFFFRSNH